MTDPTPTPGIDDAIGTMIHGSRWPEVKAARQAQLDARQAQLDARQAQLDEAARLNTRRARGEQFRRDVRTAFTLAAAVLVLAILTGVAVIVWTWAL